MARAVAMAPEEAAEAPSPLRLVGRVWTHEEVLQNIEPEIVKPSETPAHWPSNVRMDPARWVFWLPEGWGQGIKATANGKDLKCYVNPDGKLYYHKQEIEKVLGQQLSRREGHEKLKDAGDDSHADIDTVPQRWPDRLPSDWRIAFRRLPAGGLHKVYIAPAVEEQEDFFFWHMKDVEAFLAGSRATKGTPLHGYKVTAYLERHEASRQNAGKQAFELPVAETPPSKRRRQHAAEAVEAVSEEQPPEAHGSSSKRPREGATLSSFWAGRIASSKSKEARQVLCAAAEGRVVEVSDSEGEDCSRPPPAGSAAAAQGSSRPPPAVSAPAAAAPAIGAGKLLAERSAVDVEDASPEPPPAAAPGHAAAAACAPAGAAPQRAPASAEEAPQKPSRKPSFVRRPSTASVEAAAAAPAGGMSPASLEEFFVFLQCQVCMEAREILGKHVDLQDPGARALWQDYEAFVTPNLGATERWVPYHTALGVHEFFLIDSVHHRNEPLWDAKRRFLSIFIFRAHCKRDFFNQAQLPHLLREDFWRDPVGAFAPDGVLERSMREYRRRTKQPLLTLAMRMIPERLLADDDDNLVRSIVLRTQRLLEVAEQIWPVIQDPHKPAGQRFTEISQLVQTASGLGETWAKMITVCLDLAYPRLGLLGSQCDVGIGAQAPLRCLLPEGGPDDPREALAALLRQLNGARDPSSKHFWGLLPKVEELVRQRYSSLPLILDQVRTERGKMTAVTLQVQLCEYRQFRNSLARIKFGLPGDESMKLPEKPKRMRSEDHLEFDEAGQRLLLHIPVQEGQQPQQAPQAQQEGQQPQQAPQAQQEPLEVLLAAAGGSRRLAERVALLCFERLRDGASREEAVAFREELCKQCKASLEDVPDDSEAWQRCRVTLKHKNPLVGFVFQAQGGPKIAFQTTVAASGGIVNAERIARLCYARFEAGASKEAVLAYRAELYRRGTGAHGSLFR